MIVLVQILSLLVSVLLSVAFFSLFERKVMGLIQSRKGPNKVGMGVLQPMSDAMKLLSKVESQGHSSPSFLFFISPSIFFLISSLFWILFPVSWVMIDFSTSNIFLLVLFSVGVYGLIISGWFSNSKYATLGSSRAFVQSISYEVGLTLTVIVVCLILSSSSLSFFSKFQIQGIHILSLSFFMVFLLIIFLAELNRSPFDLSEGESELVSGYSVEYGGLSYTLIFLSENMSLVWSSMLMSLLFLLSLFPAWIFLFVWIRATAPRVRFDTMVGFFWISFLPLILFFSAFFLII